MSADAGRVDALERQQSAPIGPKASSGAMGEERTQSLAAKVRNRITQDSIGRTRSTGSYVELSRERSGWCMLSNICVRRLTEEVSFCILRVQRQTVGAPLMQNIVSREHMYYVPVCAVCAAVSCSQVGPTVLHLPRALAVSFREPSGG